MVLTDFIVISAGWQGTTEKTFQRDDFSIEADVLVTDSPRDSGDMVADVYSNFV